MFRFLKKKNAPRPGGEDRAADALAPGAPAEDGAAPAREDARADDASPLPADPPAAGSGKAAGDQASGDAAVARPVQPAEPAEPAEPADGGPSAPAAGDVAGLAPLEHEADQPALPETTAPARKSWLARLRSGLSRTGQNIGGLFVGVKVDEALFEELETALIMADAGVAATEQLLTALRARVRKERLAEASQVRLALRDILADHLAPLEKPFPLGSTAPLVVMIAGVNGAGKTTSIGKLANAFQRQGASVLLAAGDTFRAAAREQLMAWGARNNVTVIAQEGGDPAAVAFDAVNAGRAREAGVVMIDTAGRLPTQLHLMEELKKIRRVIGKADAAAPHEVLLVIDGNTGQNAISQIMAFDAAINLTGLVVTKLDGTAKGGALAAVAAGSQGVRPVPVYWIGVGEGLDDLQPFVAKEFATALVGGDGA
jgi:fused signal recognition particle receptor